MKIIAGLVIMVFFSACSDNPASKKNSDKNSDTSFTITGTAAGISKGLAILTYIVDEKVHADTSNINNGHFSFTGKLQQPQEAGISFTNDDYNAGISFFAENASITITTDTAALDKPVIEGSASQKDLENFKKQLLPVTAKFDTLNKTSHDIFEAGKLTRTVGDSLFAIGLVLQKEKEALIASFVKANDGSPVSAWAISKNLLSDPSIETLEPLFNSLGTKNQSGLYGRIIHEAILSAKATAIGQPAINFTQPDTSGKIISLSSFKGKYVLIDFWASWCGPCRTENPNVVKAYNQYKGKGFNILGVSLDTDKEAWLKAIKKDNLTWLEISDLKGWRSTTVADYGIKGIPFNVLLDTSGVIIAKNLRADVLQEKLKEIFK